MVHMKCQSSKVTQIKPASTFIVTSKARGNSPLIYSWILTVHCGGVSPSKSAQVHTHNYYSSSREYALITTPRVLPNQTYQVTKVGHVPKYFQELGNWWHLILMMCWKFERYSISSCVMWTIDADSFHSEFKHLTWSAVGIWSPALQYSNSTLSMEISLHWLNLMQGKALNRSLQPGERSPITYRVQMHVLNNDDDNTRN